MKYFKYLYFCIFIIIFTLPVFSKPNINLELTSQKVIFKNGIETYISADNVSVGDIIIYKIIVSNNGDSPATNVKPTGQIPKGTIYFPEKNLSTFKRLFSIDNGITFEEKPTSIENTKLKTSETYNYNKIQWVIDKINPNQKIILEYKVEVAPLNNREKNEYKNKNDYNKVMSYANSGDYSQAIESFYYMNKNNSHYKEISKKIPTWKKLQAKKDLDSKYYSELSNAQSYADSRQYNQAIYYAQQISKKNPYYKEAQMRILQWKDAMLNMNNNSNNNNYSQSNNSSKQIEQMRNNCIAQCQSAKSICESNANLLPSGRNISSWSNGKEWALYRCNEDYNSCVNTCKN